VKLPLRVSVAIVAAAVISAWGFLEYYGVEAEAARSSRDPYMVAAQHERFASLRDAAPAGTTIGYITDLDPASTGAAAAFTGAQYVLAPLLLRKTPDAEVVLGNFSRPADFAAIGAQHGLQIERDLGQGVILFRRAAK
jgi:hypothetical protein